MIDHILGSDDIYTMLSVKRGIDEDELKKLYRKMSLKVHPDKNPNDPRAQNAFAELSNAYDKRNNIQIPKTYTTPTKSTQKRTQKKKYEPPKPKNSFEEYLQKKQQADARKAKSYAKYK